jgi:membrane fusion protein (multidrug efflux system)
MQRYFKNLFFAFILLSPALSQANKLPGVVVTTVEQSDLTPVFHVVGRIEATERVELLPRVSGYIEERLFTEGGSVTKGQLLFRIEKAPYNIALQQAQADLAGAQAGLKNAEAELSRMKVLRKKSAVSKSDLELAEANRDQNKAQVMLAQAGLDNANLNLSYTEIKSPIDGRIGQANFSVGNLISPNTTTLATVVTIDPIYVELNISEKIMQEARRNGLNNKQAPIHPTLVLSDGSSYSELGTFTFISPEVNRNTDTLMVRVSFPNKQGLLLPGEFVKLQIEKKNQKVLVAIPQSAVQKNKDNYYVLVIDKENKVEVRPVQLGRQQQGQWEVKAGLVIGERIIVEGLQKVRPGAEVNPVEQTASPKQ